ncbi:threonine/serine exporter family protein [Nakamurella endophytica]|uniref:Threonine/serine exporter family protein n=1 Tax=Nakamurella endophytica TaxID=1748367 RepID=A0A917SRH3_9ACTN|nr:threonine/serine exporter family protein [Nakamurella endophytica]GGL92459.1 hypothetical protein GCM10011594_10260 [Nakamurella endophytica]
MPGGRAGTPTGVPAAAAPTTAPTTRATTATTTAPTTPATTDAEADLVAAAVAGLYANGAGSDRVVDRAGQLARSAGGRVAVTLGWTESSLRYTDRAGRSVDRSFSAPPTAIGMNRVMAVDDAVNRFAAGRLSLPQARAAVDTARALPPANVWLFAAACAVGAACLAVIFGVDHWEAVALIAVAAGGGAFLRRAVARFGGSNFWQAGLAALLAGLIGALAVDADLSSPLRLAAVCPCMVLVPGPHLLNGSFDLAGIRIPLGIARLAFATITLLAIGAGLVVGLTAGGADLVLDPAGRDVPLWLDAAAAGVVAVCYGVFYSAPLRILVWPLVVGAAVHALRWVAIEHWHLESYLAAGLACLVAGLVLLPVCRRFQVPFSAVGFASVVSLMPGLLVFRTVAGLAMLQDASGQRAQQLVQGVMNDSTVALLTVAAMAIGFILAVAVDRVAWHATGPGPTR